MGKTKESAALCLPGRFLGEVASVVSPAVSREPVL